MTLVYTRRAWGGYLNKILVLSCCRGILGLWILRQYWSQTEKKVEREVATGLYEGVQGKKEQAST